ncbi:heme A synthase [Shewanella sp. NIFS-20-20]|uniref:COX15/CtaA family protein n=1 Tax=Shewanella sp. NIFS-20-20 TaxID=2853806 RepID=UPI001C46BFEF|nr:COX15/CtaA family protein [Shewanella sp. NIFS-20-20]MBV7316936.1 COX15/CtaA family protein [Shewanella sp. NIFS-20-20]
MKLTLLVKITLALTFFVILMGAYTRLADAGLGCPDWPGCYGKVFVPSSPQAIAKAELAFPERPVEAGKAWLEMIHRYVASSLGLLIILICIQAWRQKEAPKKLPILILVLVLFQGALGMWTVTLKLMPIVVMAHLLGGFSIFSLLYLLYLRLKPLRIPGGDYGVRPLKGLAMACLAVLVVQISLGGWTSSNYAALACTQLPICEADWWNNLSPITAFNPIPAGHTHFEFGVLAYAERMTIHVFHRVWALITALLLIFFWWRLQHQSRSSAIKRGSQIMLTLLLLQVSLGMANVVLHIPLAIAVSHNLVAALLLLSLIYLNYAIWRKA